MQKESDNTSEAAPRRKSTTREYVEALLTALIIAFFVRSFVVEAFKIPSGSMIPTLMIGDHIFVNKFSYGLRIPFTKKKIVTFGVPERGESIVFIYPIDESKDFIKRVIGLSGDRIRIRQDEVIVNGSPLERQAIQVRPVEKGGLEQLQVIPEAMAEQTGVHSIPSFRNWEEYRYYLEQVGRVRHLVQFDERTSYEERDIVVPPGHLFVMGDNRDNSSDSRDWGFVPIENVKGKAMFIWLSINYDQINADPWWKFWHWIRWDRFGKWIR